MSALVENPPRIFYIPQLPDLTGSVNTRPPSGGIGLGDRDGIRDGGRVGGREGSRDPAGDVARVHSSAVHIIKVFPC